MSLLSTATLLITIAANGTSYNLDIYCDKAQAEQASNAFTATKTVHYEYKLKIHQSNCNKRVNFTKNRQTLAKLSSLSLCAKTLKRLTSH